MNHATIFYINDQWLDDNYGNPWGVRYEGQILPSGSIPVGFLKRENGEVKELIDIPYMLPHQEKSWNEALEVARDALRR